MNFVSVNFDEKEDVSETSFCLIAFFCFSIYSASLSISAEKKVSSWKDPLSLPNPEPLSSLISPSSFSISLEMLLAEFSNKSDEETFWFFSISWASSFP